VFGVSTWDHDLAQKAIILIDYTYKPPNYSHTRLPNSNGFETRPSLTCIGITMTSPRFYYDGLPLRQPVTDTAEHATSMSFRVLNQLPREIQQFLVSSGHLSVSTLHWASQRIRRVRREWSLRGQFNLHNGLILIWVVLLWWGERSVFRQSTEACEWRKWENWVCFFA
jgi:hypothetical protein